MIWLVEVEVIVNVNMTMILTIKIKMMMRATLRVAVDSLVAFFLRAARSYPPPYLATILVIIILCWQRSFEKFVEYCQVDRYKNAAEERVGIATGDIRASESPFLHTAQHHTVYSIHTLATSGSCWLWRVG